jgi:hypothetical protein
VAHDPAANYAVPRRLCVAFAIPGGQMDVEVLRATLGWCALINLGVLLWWLALIVYAKERVRRIHGRWFPMSEERFVAFHYAGLGLFKLAVLVLNVVPYLALRIAY